MKTLLKVSAISLLVCFTSGSALAASKISNLHEWSGDWVSATDLMKDPAMDKALEPTYQTLGEKEGISAQEWKEKKLAAWDSVNVQSVHVTDDSIQFNLHDGTQITNHYTYKGEMTTPYGNGKTLNWYEFEGDKDNAFKYMIFRPSGKHEALSHFHFRNDDKSFAAMKQEKIFKTVVAPDTTAAQLAEDFAE